jgi:hypothetical protein
MSAFLFILKSCWREADKVSRALQISIVTIPNLLGLLGYTRGIIPLWGWAILALLSIAFAILIGIAIRAKALDDANNPQFSLKIGNGPEFRKKGHVTKGNNRLPAVFIKGIVETIGNRSIYDCSVFATRFERWNGAEFEPVPPPERVRLKWAHEDEHRINITPTAPAHFGIVSARANKQRIYISTQQASAITPASFEQPGKYRISLSVTGRDAPDLTARVIVDWNGDWEGLKILQEAQT